MNSNISLDQYKIFNCVFEEKSMSKAAQKLHIGQPAISMAIQKIEKAFNLSLFIRSKRGTLPTPEGQMLYAHLKQAFYHLRLGEETLFKMHQLEAGTLRIGASDTLSAGYLLPFLKEYHKRYPKVHLQVTNRPTAETLWLLREGQVDLGFINLPVEEEEGFLITPCCTIHDVLVASKAFSFPKEEVAIDQLHQYPLLMLETISITRQYIDTFAAGQGIRFTPAFELGASGLLLDFAKMDLGIAFVIKEFVQNQLGEKLFEVPLIPPIPPRHIAMIRPKNSPLSKAGATFVELIEESF